MANAYEHILPLEEVKNYLRIDEDYIEDDAYIERMIASAFGYIEKQTNHVFKPTDRTYRKLEQNNRIDIYDTPINTTEFGNNIPIWGSGYMKFCGISEVTLNVGYTSREKVPSELLDAALQMIKVWYFESEKQANTTLIPENVKEIINSHRRFILC